MHENREVFCTSCQLRQDRSVKAINHNADANVQEKSDCAIVPLSRPNKEGEPSAEVGEGRARTEENIVQSHMSPMQSGKRMSQGLHGVRQAASVRKQEQFTALLHHLSLNLLRDSFFALKRQASPGVDGVTWQEYETGLEDRLPKNLRELIREMAHENPTWGEERIADELKLKLGIRVSPRTVREVHKSRTSGWRKQRSGLDCFRSEPSESDRRL